MNTTKMKYYKLKPTKTYQVDETKDEMNNCQHPLKKNHTRSRYDRTMI